MRYSVDSITDGKAVLEDENGGRTVIETSLLPEGVREGSVLQKSGEAFIPDAAFEKKRRRKLHSVLKRLSGRKTPEKQ
ncbi:MAG: DUF3006 domain-containing protein [Clostridia bacterium]|nr:DUF3006 domain-containing protein [Clostridia bacterium]